MAKILGKDATCSIARSLAVLADAWTVLIVREALLAGTTRFQEFRDALGIAPNILSSRLDALVDQGVFERRAYQTPGLRSRDEYVLTEAGLGLNVVVAALADWGRKNRPRPDGTSPQFHSAEDGMTAELSFVTRDGQQIPPERLSAHRTPDVRLPAR